MLENPKGKKIRSGSKPTTAPQERGYSSGLFGRRGEGWRASYDQSCNTCAIVFAAEKGVRLIRAESSYSFGGPIMAFESGFPSGATKRATAAQSPLP